MAAPFRFEKNICKALLGYACSVPASFDLAGY